MRVNKAFGKIHGASFTKNEQKAIDIEIRKQLGENLRKQDVDIISTVAYNLRVQEGWGKKKIERFCREFYPMLQKLADHYEMDDSEKVWLCTYRLREDGIDIEKFLEE